ncbi:hypothetical protein DICPUDRAFT_152579 [Dictyostelium purpureum]|uniref:UDENN domain-containing protein n=1 Tax=Dictyostelium purpureum TaxID=5786 RepID=F0ZLR3_DICPU|nr:uncharacterized protein DICPUDRAFT_152579 [Dictyostelium purpureum]EGC35115.1 hypothetical protein DICPUDRAFT_152579 [Dictyostelium purpureum]|eukprot:XP_003288367.1 hypothetical protein DICPUDRAFT_152579 [Dictyostelium purpureum]
MQSIPFVKSHRRTASGRKMMDISIDVEALTNDEKLSRSLHTGVRRRSSVVDRPRLFEWFIVIGVPPLEGNSTTSLNNTSSPNTSPPLSSSTPAASKPSLIRSSSPIPFLSSSFSSPPTHNTTPPLFSNNKPEQPKILYQYPPDKPLNNLSVEFFPFPNGINVSTVSQTASHTNLFQVLYQQKNLKQPEDSFVFMMTDEKKDVLYGVCTTKTSSIGTLAKGQRFEVDIDDEPCDDESIPQVGDVIYTAPRCFCIITKYPFFPLHFDIINGLLALQHMQEITKFQNLISLSSTKRNLKKQQQQQSLSASPHTLSTSHQNNNNNNSSNNLSATTTIIVTSTDSPTPIEDPLVNNSGFRVKERPILELIEYFYNHPVPNFGQTVSYHIKVLGEQTIKFKRALKTDGANNGSRSPAINQNNLDYSDFMLKYGLFTTIQLVQPKTLIILLNSILLEKKVIFYSKTIRVLTSVIFSLISLLSPFSYQSVILPLLPNSVSSLSVQDLLAAPVPYIIGLTEMPKDVDFSDIVLYDIDSAKLTCTNKVMLFPHWEDLLAVFNTALKDIKQTITSKKTTFIPNEDQEQRLNPFISGINNHLEKLFENFKRHCVRNVTEQKSISIFVKESFIFTEFPDFEEHQDWMGEFLKTLMFSVFLDQKLRLEDNDQLEDSI